MRVRDLKHNPKNPRKVTPAKLIQLAKSMKIHGDLSGVVFNRRTGNLVGGHQRSKQFNQDTEVKITKSFDPPTPVGTVAVGFLIHKGERYSYREVDWSREQELAANIAANKNAGEFDLGLLAEQIEEIGSSFNTDIDLDTTMFDEIERKQFASVDEFIAEEHWTENFEPPEGCFKFVVSITDESLINEFLKKAGIKTIKKKTGKVWSISYPEGT